MTQDRKERSITPVFYAMSKILTADAPYHVSERLIVLAVVQRMNREGSSWPSLADIAKRTGLDRRTVSKWLSLHLNGPAPLLARHWVPGRRSPTYTLVRDPIKFAEGRDTARADVQDDLPKTWDETEGAQTDPPKTRDVPTRAEQDDPPSGANASSLRCNAIHTTVQNDPPKTFMKTIMKTSMKTNAPNGALTDSRPLTDEEIDDYLARYQRGSENRESAIKRLGLLRAGGRA